MSRRKSFKAPVSALPQPLVWTLAVCLFALAAVAVIAVASLAGFTPQQLIDLIHEASAPIRAVRG